MIQPDPWAEFEMDQPGPAPTPAPMSSPGGWRQVRGPTAPMPTPRDPVSVGRDQAEIDRLDREQRRGDRTPAQVDEANRGGYTAQQLGDIRAGIEALPGLRARIDEIERLFQRDWEGPDRGTFLGMGGERNAGGWVPPLLHPNPNMRALDNAAQALVGPVAEGQGTTGGEMNSLAELRARFGPLLPTPTDGDEEIRRKIRALRELIGDQEAAWMARLEGVPAEQATVEEYQRRRQGQGVAGAGGEGGGQPPTLGGPGGAPREQVDMSSRHIMSQEAQQTNVATSAATRREDNPALAGVRNRLNQLIHSGADRRRVVEYLSSVGINVASDQALSRSIDEVLRWKREHPNYRGSLVSPEFDDHIVEQTPMTRAVGAAVDNRVGAAAVSTLDGLTGYHLDDIAAASGGNGEIVNAGLAELRDRYPGSSVVGDVAAGASLYGIGRRAATSIGTRLGIGRAGAPATGTFSRSAMAGDAAIGAYQGSGLTDDPVTGAGWGAAIGLPAGILGRGVINTAARSASPTGGALREAYLEGSQPTIGQRAGGALNAVEQAYQSAPIVGGVQRGARQGARDQWERGAFNRALRHVRDENGQPVQLPENMALGTAPHEFMQRTFRNAYNRVHSQLTAQYDNQMAQDFAALKQVTDALGDTERRQFEALANNGVLRRLQQGNGSLSGEEMQATLSDIRARISRINSGNSTANERELAAALETLEDTIYSSARRHSPANVIQQLDDIDTGYAHVVRIEDAARSGGAREAGRFNARQLINAERRAGGLRSRAFLRGDGLMTDYAQSGLRLVDDLPDSGTPIRSAVMGGSLAGMGPAAMAFIDPVTGAILAAPWAISTLLTSPGIKRAVNAYLAPNRPGMGPVRQQIHDRARLGPVLTLPAGLGLLGSE